MKIVIIASKPDVARRTLPLILPDHDHHDVHVVSVGIWGPFKRRMPRGLAMHDHPHVGTPLWKVKARHIPCFAWREGERRTVDASPFDLLANADQAICITDPFAVEVHSTAMILTHAAGLPMDVGDGPDGASAGYERIAGMDPTLPSGDEPYPELRWLPMRAHDARGMRDMWEKGFTTHSPWFRSFVAQGAALRHFNNAFEINARAVIDPIIREIVPGCRGGLITGDALQLFYHLGDHEGRGEGQVFSDMDRWSGTGRYDPEPLGSIATRVPIIESLIASGIVERDMGQLSVTSAGRTLLARLHETCRDVDQPGRLRAWSEAWPASRPDMERYLGEFFGRQKDHAFGTEGSRP